MRHSMPGPRITRPTWYAALLGLVATLATATAATARPVTAYVTNYNDDTVTPIDLATNLAGAPIPVGDQPHVIAITPDAAKAYVANYAGSSVTPIDLATNTAGPPIPVGPFPYSIAISPDGRTAWALSLGHAIGSNAPPGGHGSTLTLIDTVTDTATLSIPIPDYPFDLVNRPGLFVNVSPDGTTLYLTGEPNVTTLDLASGTFGTPTFNQRNPRASLLSIDGARLLTVNAWTYGIDGFDTSTLTNVFSYNLDGFTLTPIFINGLTLTPDGATAYVSYIQSGGGGVIPVDLATGSKGTKIPHGGGDQPGPAAITPDGATLIRTGVNLRDVRLWSRVTGTPGAIIPVGNYPSAIAVTPDQAPIARLSVTPGATGSPTTFDASASTVTFGTIASYAWDFGDGTTDVTTTPITTHTYDGGSYTASVTLTSSAGTSTERVFNGQTMMRNGGPQARATALIGSVVQLGAPIVSIVSPSAGLVAGGDSVNILGSGFTGATAVSFGGIPAASFIVNGDNSITATTPAALAAGAVDVKVTNSVGASAITPVDRFTYLAGVPPVTTPCPDGGCIAVFPTAAGMTVSASSSTGCAV